jgi:acetylornithine deacetylase
MERRILPDEREAEALDEVRGILHDLSRDDPTFRGSAAAMFSRPGYEIPSGHGLPARLADAVRRAGGQPRIAGASFWTDAAVLGHAGIPSVLFGPGGAGLHSTEEYVEVADVLFCRDVLVQLAGNLTSGFW